MRTRTPFIETFKKLQEEKNDPARLGTVGNLHHTPKPDLAPKSMSQSFQKVVSRTSIRARDHGGRS
jgi:hypothetical protein